MTRARRLLLVIAAGWLVVAALGDLVLAILGIPPGPASDQSQSQTDVIRLLAWMAWPIFTLVIAALAYAVLLGRVAPDAPQQDALRLRGQPRIAAAWIAVTSAIVLSLAVFGTVTLTNEQAAESLGVGGRAVGGGATTGGHVDEAAIEVQVIAQQWSFTYRYPAYGGMESAHLVLPSNTPILLHVTSLDVIHSFWFPALGVKADALPLTDNIFAVTARQLGTYRIQCAELCGLWHGSMDDNTAMVMSPADFKTWATGQQAADAAVMQYLPPYSHTYKPDPGAYGT